MLKVTSVFLTVLMLAGIVGCAKKLPPQPVSNETLSQADLQYYWQVNLGLAPGETIEWVLLLDENLYCLTDSYTLYALDAAKGLLKWTFQVADPGQTVFLPTHVDGLRLSKEPATLEEMLNQKMPDTPAFDAVLINTLTELLVLNRETGGLQRRGAFDFPANTTGVSDGKDFYCGSTKGRYYGIRMWESVQDWVLSTDDMITAPLRYNNGMLYLADESGLVIATRTGISEPYKVWTRKLEGSVTAPFYVGTQGCFVPCDNNRLYAFDPQNGQDLWGMPFVCQGPLYDAVQVGDELVYQYASGDVFYAINPSNGNMVWSIVEGRQVLMIANGKVYLRCIGNRLMVIDNMSGEVIRMVPLTGWDMYANNVKDSGVYMASRQGQVGCLRLLGAGQLTKELLKK